jgi:hypothetical protein
MFLVSTPYLSADTICSGRRLKQFTIGDELVLIQRVIKAGTPQYLAITGTVTGPSIYKSSNSYSYIIDKKDTELAGLNMPFISNGEIIREYSHNYSTKSIAIDMIQPYNSRHNNIVILKTVGVLRPESFISLTVSFKTDNLVTHTLLVTKEGFMVVIN